MGIGAIFLLGLSSFTLAGEPEPFGNDYDFDDLTSNSGSSDADSDGLPDSFEGNGACFYKEMKWVDASGTAAADAIKADMTGLEASEKAEFDNNIDACAAWSG